MQANIKSIPEKIYLVTGLYEDELNEIVDFNDLTLLWSTSKKFFHDIEYIISSPPVEQTVDAGQLEKIIGDAFDTGINYGFYSKHKQENFYWAPDKAQYIKQAIEQFKNSKK